MTENLMQCDALSVYIADLVVGPRLSQSAPPVCMGSKPTLLHSLDPWQSLWPAAGLGRRQESSSSWHPGPLSQRRPPPH